jgi:phenylacetate-CoA ligase
MNLIDYSLILNKFPVKQAQKELQEIQKLSDIDFEIYIKNKKEEIVNFHLNNNDFYKSFVSKKKWDWNSLPILQKEDLQLPLEKRLSEGYTLKNIFKNNTSGSTGNPFSFAKDKFSHALTWSIIKNRFNWHGLYGEKQARFYGMPKKMVGKGKELTKDFLSHRFRFNVFDLTDVAFDKWINKFSSTKFIYLNGYTSVLVVFAKYLNTKGLVLKEICPSLNACVVTSEMLFDNDKELLNKAFGVKIINEYGASELDLIAFEDEKNNWILNTETLFVEVLDEENKILEDGKVGNIVITSLYNKAHPFIRYKIGDKGAIKKISPKKTILQNLEGRSEDLVKLPSGKVAPGLTFYYITKSIMEDSAAIKEIKIIQTKIDTFKVNYVSGNKLDKSQEEKIRQALKEYLEVNLNIDFFRLEKLERTKSGKLKQFTSLIKE